MNESAVTAEEIVSNNEMIELTSFDAFTKKTEDCTPDELAKYKAILYRFYSHIQLKDGYYYCDLSSGKDIQVSEAIFNNLIANLKEINENARLLREKGHVVNMPEVTDEYLKSLLQE